MDAEVLWHPSVRRNLPATKKIIPRPVLARRLRRLEGEPGPITEEEMRDAVRILEEFYGCESMAWLYAEAEMIFNEAGGG